MKSFLVLSLPIQDRFSLCNKKSWFLHLKQSKEEPSYPPPRLPEMQWLAVIFFNNFKAKFVCVLLRQNLTSYQNWFTIPNSPNQIYWTKFVPWGLNLIYWNKFSKPNFKILNPIHESKCMRCEEPNIPQQINSIKPTKLNQFYQTKYKLTSLINFMHQILNEVK